VGAYLQTSSNLGAKHPGSLQNGRFRPATYKEHLYTYHSAEKYMMNIKKDEWYLSRLLSAICGDVSVPLLLEFTLSSGPPGAQCDAVAGGDTAMETQTHAQP
jgi:hypothetical protein